VGGAIPGKDFLALLEQTGFKDAELTAETGFNTSPVTKGVLLRAVKPLISIVQRVDKSSQDLLDKYQEFSDAVYSEGALDRKTKHLIALGASLTMGCEPWTRYCLAVARELGATDAELRETMALAISVGATKIKTLQESVSSSLLKDRSPEARVKDEKEKNAKPETSSS
jgi:AhpD family alkylhydroperoxidase